MKRIALLSDTHHHLDLRMMELLAEADEIWHAGDIGSLLVTDKLKAIKPLRAVYGNIDGTDLRSEFPAILHFTIEDVKVCMLHICGYPGHYQPAVKQLLRTDPPQLLVAGHSHILKVIYDKEYQLLYINPGAAGQHGFHLMRTMVRFTLDNGQIKDLEVIELGRRGISMAENSAAPV